MIITGSAEEVTARLMRKYPNYKSWDKVLRILYHLHIACIEAGKNEKKTQKK